MQAENYILVCKAVSQMGVSSSLIIDNFIDFNGSHSFLMQSAAPFGFGVTVGCLTI